MTVIQYCREKTEVRELVIIRSGGYERYYRRLVDTTGVSRGRVDVFEDP